MRSLLRSLLGLLIGLTALPALAADRPLLFSFEAASSQLGLTRMREAQYADRAAFAIKVKDELLADIFRAVGVDHQKEYAAPDGRPIMLTPYHTQPVSAVLA